LSLGDERGEIATLRLFSRILEALNRKRERAAGLSDGLLQSPKRRCGLFERGKRHGKLKRPCARGGLVWSGGKEMLVRFAAEIPTPVTDFTISSRLLSNPEPTVTLKIA
jgi:hypothetical protein